MVYIVDYLGPTGKQQANHKALLCIYIYICVYMYVYVYILIYYIIHRDNAELPFVIFWKSIERGLGNCRLKRM